MTTATSSPDKRPMRALLRRLLRRNLPSMVYLGAAIFFFLTLPYLIEAFRDIPHLDDGVLRGFTGSSFATQARIYTDFSLITFYLLMMAAPVVLTLTQVSWLHSRRAVDLYHSLPVGRPALLLSHAGAAFFTIALPAALNYLVILGAGAARLGMKSIPEDEFTLPVGEILLDYLGWMTVELAIIAVILLVATQVGSVFENFAFSAELLCVPALIILLTNSICGRELLGYSPDFLNLRALAYSTPVSLMAGRYVYPEGSGWGIALWLALGALILGAAVLLYLRRPSELAETSGAREPLNTLGRMAAVYLGGLALGRFFIYVTGIEGLVLWTLAGAALVAVLIQVVLNRGFRDLPKALPAMALQAGSAVLAAVVITTGALGYAGRVPAPERARGVTINYRGFYGQLASRIDAASGWTSRSGEEERYWYEDYDTVTLTSPEAVQAVLDIHRHFAQTGHTGTSSRRITLVYGSGMKRSYSYNDRDPALFLALEKTQEFQEKTNPLYTLPPEEVVSVRLTDATGLAVSEPLTGAQAESLLAAALADAGPGQIAAMEAGTARVAAYLMVDTAALESGLRLEGEEDCWRDFTLPVFASDQATLAQAEALGLGDLLEPQTQLVAGLQANVDRTGEGFYWVGAAALLWPTDVPGEPEPSLDTIQWVQEELAAGWTIRDPQEVEALLEQGLGVGYYWEKEADPDQENQGFVVTILGRERLGASFWIPREAATASIREEYSYLWEED